MHEEEMLLQATLGGDGFRPRVLSHREEVRAGTTWLRSGLQSEVEPLRRVLLAWPGDEVEVDGEPNQHLMLERMEVEPLRRETAAIKAFYESQDIAVHLCRPSRRPSPNFIYMRDLFFMTPEGAVLARPASEQRAGEEGHAAAALAEMGVPILMTPRERATFEGADALWLDMDNVLVGVGRRTNQAGYDQLSRLLASMGVKTIAIQVPAGVQHLLGMLNFVDDDLAVLHEKHASAALRRVLQDRGVQCINLPAGTEVDDSRAMNFVTLAPRCIVMPAGCPVTRERLTGAGVICYELDVRHYLRGAGALGCLTGIIERGGVRRATQASPP
ncbi:dimethylarginine dimethylaminohydrolase family protein [Sorangium sp. So ce1128]